MSGGMPSWAISSSSAAIFGEEAKAAPSTSKVPQQQQATTPLETRLARRRQKSVMRCAPTPLAEQHADAQGSRAALAHVTAVQASQAGFDAATRSALHQVEHLTERFLTGIFAAAQHAAELACRDSPSARDLLYAIETHGLSIAELQHFHNTQQQAATATRVRAAAETVPTTMSALLDVDWMGEHDAFLPSDSDQGSEEDSWSVSSGSDGEFSNRRTAVEARVHKHRLTTTQRAAKRQKRHEKLAERQKQDPDSQLLVALESGEEAWHRVADHVVPRHLPGMPPRHTWVSTAAYPTNAYSASDSATGLAKNHPLVLVNRKLANARLVESSLRRLIQNTDGAAATAYSASRRVKAADTASQVQQPVEKTAAAVSPRSTSPMTAALESSSSVSGAPTDARTPARSSLTLRLKNKMSNNSSTASSPTAAASPVGQSMASPASLPPSLSRRPTMPTALTTGATGSSGHMLFRFGSGLDPLMSPVTPMTPSYPATTPGGTFSSGAAASTGFNWTGLRSRTNSVALPSTAKPADLDQQDAELQMRIPAAVNYKNVWYAPGSTIQSGGLASNQRGSRSSSSTTTKRLRKWKV